MRITRTKCYNLAETPSFGDLTYQVKIKSEDRVILDHVSGWSNQTGYSVNGASGAGKTTLLNALSDRLTTGVVTEGIRLVNGRPLDSSFQRSIGYVQQQDLHLETSTVSVGICCVLAATKISISKGKTSMWII